MANFISTNLLNYLGMIGTSGMRTGSLVPRPSTPQSAQELYKDFQQAGQVADPDIWSRYGSSMRRPVTFDSMLQLWDEMASWDLMAAALVEIVDEATQVDANSPSTIWYQCNDKEFEDSLNQMLSDIAVEDIIQSQIWHLAAFGNHFEKIEYAPEEGVLGLGYVHPFDIRRYWLERNRKCVGFRHAGKKPDKSSAFVGPDNRTPIERVVLSDGKDTEELFYPWDFLHMRRMFRLRMSEHGEPVFDEAQGVYKKLKMAVDQMVVHRAQVQPDRYAIKVDTGTQPPTEQSKTIQRWKQSLRSKLAFGQSQTGQAGGLNSPSEFSSFYNAWALDTILWIANPTGMQHSIEKLPGTANIPDIYDIELLTDLFYSIIGMPRSWFASKQGGGAEAPSGKSLLAQDIRFLRKVKSIRRPLINCYTWLGYFHAVLKKKRIEQLDIRAQMPPIGGLEEQMKMEMLKMQAETLDMLADVMEKYSLPKEAWIEIVFKKYMHLPDDIVNLFITSLPAEKDPVPVESLQARKPAPYSYKLIREIENAVKSNPEGARLITELKRVVKLQDSLAGFSVIGAVSFKKNESVMSIPQMKQLDLIVSSYGKHPFELAGGKFNSKSKIKVPLQETLYEREEGHVSTVSSNSSDETQQREPAYRRWIKTTSHV